MEEYYKHKYLKYRHKYLLEQYGGKKAPAKCNVDRTNADVGAQLAALEKLKDMRREEITQMQNFTAYDPTRFPSYCDRILYRIIQLKNADPVDIKQIAYGSYVNNVIAKSDHNLVYGTFVLTMENTTINILVVTWNQSATSPKISEVLDKGFFNQLNLTDMTAIESFDIVCFSQQESVKSDSWFGIFEGEDSLQRSIIDRIKREAGNDDDDGSKAGSSKAGSSKAGTHVVYHDRVGTAKFYVRQSIIVRKDLDKKIVHTNVGNKCLSAGLCTKSISGIGLTLGGINPPLTLNFFAVHLPVDTKKSDMGLDLRIKAYKSIDKFMESKFVAKSARKLNQVDFVAGDFNFRYNVGNISGDQLDQLRADKTVFEDFDEEDRGFAPSCKLRPCKK